MAAKDLLTVREAAELLGVSHHTIRTWIHRDNGRMPPADSDVLLNTYHRRHWRRSTIANHFNLPAPGWDDL